MFLFKINPTHLQQTKNILYHHVLKYLKLCPPFPLMLALFLNPHQCGMVYAKHQIIPVGNLYPFLPENFLF